MAQNVTIAGNQYPSVPSVLIPKTGGGGNAIFADPSVVTAVAADVASGKYFLNSSGVLTQGTASGGGGASNIVTGTFKGTTTGAAMDVTLNYSGSGYPIAVGFFPSEGGYNPNGALYNLIQRYVYTMIMFVKNNPSTTPSYSNSENDKFTYQYRYKSSSTSATSAGTFTGTNAGVCNDADAKDSITSSNCTVRFKNNKKMSVYIASTSYGFAANIEYTYYVIYSS